MHVLGLNVLLGLDCNLLWINQWGAAFGCRRAWFVHGLCSFCSLVWSVRSAVTSLSCWAAMRGAVNIESLERSVLLLEWHDEDANESVAADASSRVCLVKCCCGRLCKGNRGLKMHQRSCSVVLGLNDQLRADLNDAVLTDQESGNVGDPLMASSVPSPQPEDHC